MKHQHCEHCIRQPGSCHIHNRGQETASSDSDQGYLDAWVEALRPGAAVEESDGDEPSK